MAEETQEQPKKSGFELDGVFFSWRVSDGIKDLQLIDRLTNGIPTAEFFRLIDDPVQRQRGPIMLALMATSIRAENPGFSVERIVRRIEAMESIDDATFIEPEPEKEEDEKTDPTPEPATEEKTKD